MLYIRYICAPYNIAILVTVIVTTRRTLHITHILLLNVWLEHITRLFITRPIYRSIWVRTGNLWIFGWTRSITCAGILVVVIQDIGELCLSASFVQFVCVSFLPPVIVDLQRLAYWFPMQITNRSKALVTPRSPQSSRFVIEKQKNNPFISTHVVSGDRYTGRRPWSWSEGSGCRSCNPVILMVARWSFLWSACRMATAQQRQIDDLFCTRVIQELICMNSTWLWMNLSSN